MCKDSIKMAEVAMGISDSSNNSNIPAIRNVGNIISNAWCAWRVISNGINKLYDYQSIFIQSSTGILFYHIAKILPMGYVA